ncbi:invasion associated locus B family protein [Palleronia sp. LCG004]|uniref:invasion associated locus B family protein n=1 Tax=Palleronia sp. LCG004 TaxID=3079304 RepID=UPI0029435E12|nr:invasion associated locus B family protein [Palleronia sp. LCG004]WOI56787.1 invasion associated locus B family protein [Palleronia sp. LCG004]
MKTLSVIALMTIATPLAAQDQDATGETAPDAQSEASEPAGTDAQTGAETPEGETEGAPGDLSMGEEVQNNQIGRTYTEAEFSDWQQRCIRTENESDPCQLYQLLYDQDGNAVAEISIFPLPEGQQAVAGATIITPLETLLTRQLTLAVDDGQAKRYPFDFCADAGCFARIGLTDAEVNSFRRGAEARISIVPAAAPDQTITLPISLSGFTAGFDALEVAN